MISPQFNLQEEITIEQLRDLQAQISQQATAIDNLANASETAEETLDIVPALNNFLNNTDFIYSDENYNGSTYADDDKVLAEWLVKTQASATAWSPSTLTTESVESITTSTYPVGVPPAIPSVGAVWDTSAGSILMTGGYKIASKLPSKNAHAGSYMAFNMNISKPTGITIADDLICKVSIFDNTDLEILTGSVPTLTSTKSGSHDGGGVIRQYILEVMMPDGRSFYSNTSSFTTNQNQVELSVSAVNPNSSDTVVISWDRIFGASRYRVYRRTPSEADTNWYLVATITNGTPQAVDTGGRGGGVWTVPSFDNVNKQYAKAEAFYDDISSLLAGTEESVENISLGIRVPSNFVVDGNQYVVVEFLKDDYTNTTTAEIPTNGIRIDKVGISYTNGRWTPSAKDMALDPIATGTPNPPASGGGSGGNPPSGGGGNTCVADDTPILMWSDDGNHYYVPAHTVVIGDRLVCWDGEKINWSKVSKIITGIANAGYWVTVNDNSVLSSFSHKYINDFDDFEEGTRITMQSKQLVTITDDYSGIEESEIDCTEKVKMVFRCRTFLLSNNRRNYVSNGIFSHNAKPFNPIE